MASLEAADGAKEAVEDEAEADMEEEEIEYIFLVLLLEPMASLGSPLFSPSSNTQALHKA